MDDHVRVGILNFSHFDLSWLGTQDECLSQGMRIIATALNEAERDPSYRFHIEYAIFLDHFLRIHPEQATRLKRLMAAGQIEAGPTWTGLHNSHQPGETLVRNILYAKLFLRESLGVDAIGCTRSDLPDYTPQEAQIFAKSGVPFIQMTRQGPREERLFWAESPDGSRVLVWADNPLWNAGGGYGWSLFRGLADSVARMRELHFEEELAADLPNSKAPLYLIQAGNDLLLPLPELPERVRAWNKQSPLQLELMTMREYYAAVRDTQGLAVLRGEVPCSWAYLGLYYAHHYLLDQEATFALLAAERLATLAHATRAVEYPGGDLRRAWLSLAKAGDHNYDCQGVRTGDARKLDERKSVIWAAAEITRAALAPLAEQVHVQPNSMGLVVFNPSSWPRREVASAHFTMYWHKIPRRWDILPDESVVTDAGDPARSSCMGVPCGFNYAAQGFEIVDDQGKQVPYQITEDICDETRDVALLFPAETPPLGYRTYSLRPVKEPPRFATTTAVYHNDVHSTQDWVMQNRWLRVRVGADSFTIEDLQRRRTLVRKGSLPLVRSLPSDFLSGYLPDVKTWGCRFAGASVTETGGVRTVLHVDVESEHPDVRRQALDFTLYEHAPILDITMTVDARGNDLSTVQVSLPTGFVDPKLTYAVPYGVGDVDDTMPGTDPRPEQGGPVMEIGAWRATRMVQGWLDVSDAQSGLTIASNCRVFRLEGNVVSCLVQLISRRIQQPLVCHFRLTPHDGNWREAQAQQAAENLLMPLAVYTVNDTVSPKSAPGQASLLSVQPANVAVGSMKRAEDGVGVIVRLVETSGQRTVAHVETCLLVSEAYLCDLLENNLRPASLDALPLAPFEIATLRLVCQPGRGS